MANYISTWRSNYFKVKDVQAFERALEHLELQVVKKEDTVAIMQSNCSDGSGIPTWSFPDEGEDQEIDWGQLFAEHLQEGEVAILMEAGAEKLRYVVGNAVAYNHKGECLYVDLDQIYSKAQEEWGTTPRRCEC